MNFDYTCSLNNFEFFYTRMSSSNHSTQAKNAFTTCMLQSSVVHRTFGFSRTSFRDSAKLFGSAESYFHIFDQTKIRPNRICNVKYRIFRPNHEVCAKSLPNLLTPHFQFFLRARVRKETQNVNGCQMIKVFTS